MLYTLQYAIGDKIEIVHDDGNWHGGIITKAKQERLDGAETCEFFVEFFDGESDWVKYVAHEFRKPILESAMISEAKYSDAKTLEEAMNAPDANEWREAFKTEMMDLIGLGTFEVVKVNEMMTKPRIMKTKYVLKIKKDSDGKYVKHKVRLTACGYSQVEGVDYDFVSAPVLAKDECRLLFALAAKENYVMSQWDAIAAFPSAPCDEHDLYIQVPKGLKWMGIDQYQSDDILCLKLKNQLYGTKQSARAFHKMMKKCLGNEEFAPVKSALWNAQYD